jgi:hypothetical protein
MAATAQLASFRKGNLMAFVGFVVIALSGKPPNRLRE